MEKIMNTLQVVDGCTWRDAIENADLLNLNLAYDYDKDGSGYIPVEDYPSGNIHIGTCYNPYMIEGYYTQYPYDIILLGRYEGRQNYCYDEYGNAVDVRPDECGYALFANNNGLVNLVKATDKINIDGEYQWRCVATLLITPK